jgi:hypothetical protein
MASQFGGGWLTRYLLLPHEEAVESRVEKARLTAIWDPRPAMGVESAK